MLTLSSLAAPYARNLFFVKNHTKDLSHADALLTPHPKGNCANWILGHIAAYRNKILEHLGAQPTLDERQADRYQANSAPVLGDEPGIAQLDVLIAAIESAQSRIEDGLRNLSAERAAEVTKVGAWDMTRAEALLFLLRHEAYHTGQLELLAELKAR
jgi:uncharacterized damage-inducible protein DinB